MRIDPSRLSRLLSALSQNTAETRTEKLRQAPPSQQGQASAKPARDIKTLRKSLQSRLRSLSANDSDYDSLSSTITIQEILVWEFGQDILDRPDFHRITSSITETMLQDERIAASLRKLVRELIA